MRDQWFREYEKLWNEREDKGSEETDGELAEQANKNLIAIALEE